MKIKIYGLFPSLKYLRGLIFVVSQRETCAVGPMKVTNGMFGLAGGTKSL